MDFVVVLVLVLDKILICEDDHEDDDEYEKNQIRSRAYALRLFLFSAFQLPAGVADPQAGGRADVSKCSTTVAFQPLNPEL